MLMHCPLVPLTSTSMALLPSGFILGNPAVVIPRLAALRGSGLEAHSDAIEQHLLQRLAKQFMGEGVTVTTRTPYADAQDHGDIDLAIYESESRRVVLAQMKTFISPDTVDEVMRANSQLAQGLEQIQRVRAWCARHPDDWLRRVFKIDGVVTRRVQLAVLGNGFAGSDFLSVPDDVDLVDAHFLLRPGYQGASSIDAIDQFRERLRREVERAITRAEYTTLEIDDVRLEVRGQVLSLSR